MYMTKVKGTAYLAAGLIVSLWAAANSASAGTVTHADPTPAGIRYFWTATLGDAETNGVDYQNKRRPQEGCDDRVSFAWRVGAKSWNEPPPTYEPPYSGWTHTSNWVALDLKCDAKLTIRVARQQGVTDGTATFRDRLDPAISLWQGWQENGPDDHRYNNAGNTPWMYEVQYIGNQPNAKHKDEVVYKVRLKAGKYSIAIGGNPEQLTQAEYADLANCGQPVGPDPAICYAYTGNHGYRAEIETESMHGKPEDHD
jgi:hypothetical protein